ncbi:MAG: hypothetical protein Q9171_006051 [Xanthocarpia ochracea]
MSFSLWPSSSGAENSISSAVGRETQLSTPALDFMQLLHSSRLEVSHYRDLVKDEFFDTSASVGSGGQAVVERSRIPGVIIKRTRRLQYGDSYHISRADRNHARVMLEIRILTSAHLRSSNLFVKVLGVCFEESIADIDPSGAGQFHLLLEYSELGDLASFLGRNGEQLDTKVKIDLAYQVSCGLSLLHLNLICHGDLKVQNVLVFNGNNGRYIAKLADFGLSVHSWESALSADMGRDACYPPGTPLLNAPETRNRNLSTRSVDITAVIGADVFSFGLLLWEILKDGRSYFNMAWMDTARTSELRLGTEEQMAFLSTLPCNGLLIRGEEFLAAQDLDEQLHGQILRVFYASLQDDPLQRQPISDIWQIILPATERNSLQRRALDELKMYATSSSPFDDFDELRERAALNLAECHLISFGTGYDLAEALRWLKVAKSYSGTSSLCLRRISESLVSPPEPSERLENQLEATPEGTEIKYSDISELYLIRKIQSRVTSAVKDIRALSPEGQSWLHVNNIGWQAMGYLTHKIGTDIVGYAPMTTLEIAALLGEDEIMARLLPTAEAFKPREDQINALHCACIGGNLPLLEFLLDYGVEAALCGPKNITALHLLIYMPAALVDRAVSLLITHGAPTDTCSEATCLRKMGLDLAGTPVEWAVIARNRALVAALLPHSKGHERSVLQHAISLAYYEIADDLLSKSTLSGLFTKEDCPILIFCRPFAHLTVHGRNGDVAIERTIRLCDEHDLINYETMLRRCMVYARTRSCLKALEILFDLCPPSIIRQGFESDDHDERVRSILYTAFMHAKSNPAWRPVLEVILRNFSIAELDEVRELKASESADVAVKVNVLHTAVVTGWKTAVQVLLEKGVDIHRRVGERNRISNFDVAVQAGDIEMQAILSGYGGGNESPLEYRTANESLAWWLFLQKKMRRRVFNGFIYNSLPDKDDMDASTLFAVSKAHGVLCLLLMARDTYFETTSAHWQIYWDEFRALISNESIAGYVDTPDEDGVTMLQRAAAFLDVDIIRLLLEAGADANVPFLAKRVGVDEGDLVIPFLPFQIACWVCRSSSYRFECGSLPRGQSDTSPTKQVIPGPTKKTHILRRFTRIISRAVGIGTNGINGPKSGRDSTAWARAESFRAGSLNVVQEFLRWHLLRNDRRFEGITEIHLCAHIRYLSRGLMLNRQKGVNLDAKASWPGIEGKYTAYELEDVRWKDEWSTFLPNLRRVRGIELARKTITNIKETQQHED